MTIFALLLFLILTIMSPLMFGDVMLASLQKLHLGPSSALALMAAMFIGGLINVPVKRIASKQKVSSNVLAVYGLADFWPQTARSASETVIAVNFGGCVVPVGLSLYELAYLASVNPRALALCLAGCLVIAAVLSLLLTPDAAPPVAFVIGVMGPLVGADLLHLKDIEAAENGVASIGGAGTFDGIVLSGIIAAYLT